MFALLNASRDLLQINGCSQPEDFTSQGSLSRDFAELENEIIKITILGKQETVKTSHELDFFFALQMNCLIRKSGVMYFSGGGKAAFSSNEVSFQRQDTKIVISRSDHQAQIVKWACGIRDHCSYSYDYRPYRVFSDLLAKLLVD